MTQIHSTAIVDPKAELHSSVVVGPYAIIGPNVKVGKNTNIHSHALLQGYTTIGEDNQIFSFAAIGNPPQDLKYKGEPTLLEIGDKNIIREYVTMQPGTVQAESKTVVGSENLFMAHVHVAHDCVVGNLNVFANCVQLAGHVTIHDMSVLGGMVAIHQFVTVGNMAMMSAGSILRQDLPPFCTAHGYKAALNGLNSVALMRRNVSVEARKAIKAVYKIIFTGHHPTIDNALNAVPEEFLKFPEIQYFITFIKESKRGVIRPLSSHGNEESED